MAPPNFVPISSTHRPRLIQSAGLVFSRVAMKFGVAGWCSHPRECLSPDREFWPSGDLPPVTGKDVDLMPPCFGS